MTLGLHAADWAVLGAYAVLLLSAGWWFSRRGAKDSKGYFLAGQSMPVWAVAVSTLATAQSAATFVGVPEDAFGGDLTYISASIGGVIAALILAFTFIPAYYRLGVSTPYQLLETRFGPGAKLVTSAAYMIGRVFASGARIYVGAIPVALACFGDLSPATLAITIAAFMVFAVLFTLRGGLESVIWTDIVQVGVYMGAAVVSIVLLWRAIPADLGTVLEALRHGGTDGASKLTVLRTGLDASKPLGIDFGAPFTLITACTGWVLLNLAAFGTDQDLTQRMLTCRSAKEGARSVIASTLVGIPAVVIFSTIGLLLWVVCRRPDLMGGTIPEHLSGDAKGLLLRYAMNAGVAGFAGLIVAGVLAAGPAGINASLNSMAGTFINDIYRPVIAPGRDERHYVTAGRWAVAAWGVVLGAFAVVCIWWQKHSGENIINFVLGVMGFAYAGLLATFLTALFTRRGRTWSVIAAMIVGFVVVLALQPNVWAWWTAQTGWTKAHLASIKIASPWRLVLGVTAALLVCLVPRGNAKVVAS
ncbi:MAG TPA: hypothetical protein VHN77_12425 [Phycisphaerales bacterium]|nr:hypothetical protein [Phycisphaerales bacterium]